MYNVLCVCTKSIRQYHDSFTFGQTQVFRKSYDVINAINPRGGGYLNMFEGTGTFHYLGVPFFLKSGMYWYQFLKYVWNYGYYILQNYYIAITVIIHSTDGAYSGLSPL